MKESIKLTINQLGKGVVINDQLINEFKGQKYNEQRTTKIMLQTTTEKKGINRTVN